MKNKIKLLLRRPGPKARRTKLWPKSSEFGQIGVQKWSKIDQIWSKIDQNLDLVVHRRTKTLQEVPRDTQEVVQEGPRRPKWPPMEAKSCPKPSQNGAKLVPKLVQDQGPPKYRFLDDFWSIFWSKFEWKTDAFLDAWVFEIMRLPISGNVEKHIKNIWFYHRFLYNSP